MRSILSCSCFFCLAWLGSAGCSLILEDPTSFPALDAGQVMTDMEGERRMLPDFSAPPPPDFGRGAQMDAEVTDAGLEEDATESGDAEDLQDVEPVDFSEVDDSAVSDGGVPDSNEATDSGDLGSEEGDTE